MIQFHFSLDLPFSDRWKTVCYKSGIVKGHWVWEFNIYSTHQLIMIDTNLRVKSNHRGLQFLVGLLGYAVEFDFYNTTHEIDYE
jgi:hypothetical protein